MTVVNVRTLISALVGPDSLDRGYVVATPWVGNSPAIQVDGEDILFPREITLQIHNGVASAALDLPAIDIPYKLVVSDLRTGETIERFVIVPDVEAVDFGDLVEVNPFTYIPDENVVTAWQAAIDEVASIRTQAIADMQAKLDSLVPITDAQLAGIAADVDSEFSQAVAANIATLVGDRITILEATRGTSAERDAFYGVPSTDAARASLANERITWFNVDKGWTEMYYAVSGTSGLLFPGVKAGFPAGWYPLEGELPYGDIRNHAATKAIGSGIVLIDTYTVGTLGGIKDMSTASGQLTIEQPGVYKVKGSYVLASAVAAGGRFCQITKNSATDNPTTYLAYGPYHIGQALMYEPITSDEIEAYLLAGDVLRMFAYQTSGATVNLSRTTDAAGLADVGRLGNYFKARYLRPPV